MDPFLEVKRDVEQSIQKATDLSKRLSSASSDETKWLTEQLKGILSSIQDDVDDLEETVRVAESNPARFNLHPAEVSNRKDFINRVKNHVAQMKSTLSQASQRSQDDARNALFASKNPAPVQKNDRMGQNQTNTKLIENEQQQQQVLMRQQDQQLDGVINTVSNLKQVAAVMGRELDDQTRLLEEMEVQVDTTQGKLQHGIKRMNDFIKANSSKCEECELRLGSKQQCTIVCLIIVLIILAVMVFSM